MNVISFTGTFDTDDFNKVREVLERERVDGFNEVWLSHGGETSLLFLMRTALSVVHFFPKNGHPGFLSQGHLGGLGDQIWFRGSDSKQEIPMSSDAVVSLDEAIEAASQYCQEDRLPSCLNWLEL
jgi:hypothetical protein